MAYSWPQNLVGINRLALDCQSRALFSGSWETSKGFSESYTKSSYSYSLGGMLFQGLTSGVPLSRLSDQTVLPLVSIYLVRAPPCMPSSVHQHCLPWPPMLAPDLCCYRLGACDSPNGAGSRGPCVPVPRPWWACRS